MAAADVPSRLTDYETERATFRIEVPERLNAVSVRYEPVRSELRRGLRRRLGRRAFVRPVHVVLDGRAAG